MSNTPPSAIPCPGVGVRCKVMALEAYTCAARDVGQPPCPRKPAGTVGVDRHSLGADVSQLAIKQSRRRKTRSRGGSAAASFRFSRRKPFGNAGPGTGRTVRGTLGLTGLPVGVSLPSKGAGLPLTDRSLRLSRRAGQGVSPTPCPYISMAPQRVQSLSASALSHHSITGAPCQ